MHRSNNFTALSVVNTIDQLPQNNLFCNFHCHKGFHLILTSPGEMPTMLILQRSEHGHPVSPQVANVL